MREIAIMTAALVALSSSLDARGAVGTEAKRPGAFDTPVVSSADFAGIVEERLEMAKVKALDSLSERVAQHAKVQSGSFLLQSDFQHNAEVKVVYRIPVDARGKPTKDAHHVVFRAFFPGEMNRYETKVIDGQKTRLESANLERKLEYYSDRLGFTAFSMYIECPRTLWADPVECYFHGHQKWVDLVLRAQDELIEKFNLRNKRLFLVGHSLGGTFIQRIAAARPDRVAAVSALSAPDVVVPGMRSDTAWFLGITRGDSMAREYEDLYQKLVEQGGNVVLNIFPPDYGERGNRGFYHSISNLADSACREFLRSVAEKLTSHEEVQAQRWPFVRDRLLRSAGGYPDRGRVPEIDGPAYIGVWLTCAQATGESDRNISYGLTGRTRFKIGKHAAVPDSPDTLLEVRGYLSREEIVQSCAASLLWPRSRLFRCSGRLYGTVYSDRSREAGLYRSEAQRAYMG